MRFGKALVVGSLLLILPACLLSAQQSVPRVTSAPQLSLVAIVGSNPIEDATPSGSFERISGLSNHDSMATTSGPISTDGSPIQVAQVSTQTAQQIAGMAWLAAAGTRSSDLATIMMLGTATSTIGGKQVSGTVLLRAQGGSRSRVDLLMDSSKTSEIQNALLPDQNLLVSPTGEVRQLAIHNTWTAITWFFPAFLPISQWNSPTAQFSFALSSAPQTVTIQSHSVAAGASNTMQDVIGRLSLVRYRLDPKSYLPESIQFDTHPDGDLNTNIAVEIQYADYRSVDGALVPFRIRKYLNGGLVLDVTITSATINPTFSDSDFQAN